MKKLSVMEFKEYCEKLSPKSYIYDTANQKNIDIGNTLRVKARFCRIKISLNPNTIVISSRDNYMSFERVKQVIIDDKSLLGTICMFVCGNLQDSTNDNTYTVIAQ